jgi:hypothetical protein
MTELNNKYYNVHQWLAKNYGKASYCSNDLSHTKCVFQWANITGEYEKDVKNFKQLCRSCHAKLDWSPRQREFHRKRMTGNTNTRKDVVQPGLDGKYIARYPAITLAAMKLGISRTSIANCLTKRSHSAGGYRWRYGKQEITS